MSDSTFDTDFKKLTNYDPLPWQQALYERFLQGDFPASCNLPTGLGKTLVLAVWLLAYAQRKEIIPHRLVYVVNRRTVVDQTTIEAEKLKAKAKEVGIPEPAISTLRGQFADNREWSADPSKPAIIVGTVDMIGSRLLFSGYGVGFKARPLHAGFLGQDALLVHDEAHLEPAFQKLVETIQKEQERCGDFGRLRVMELTATSRGAETFPNTEERQANEAHPVVRERIAANKTLQFHSIEDEKGELADRICELALAHRDTREAILVFVRSVENVEKIVAKLRKEKQQVQQLTGTLRGLERDRMADPRREDGCPIFARFLKRPATGADDKDQWKIEPAQGTVYLVCTSAGEVGVNLSTNYCMICDLPTFESFAQRCGRTNRFGEGTDTQIHLMHPADFDPKDDLDTRRERTLELLRQLNGDASPAALGRLPLTDRLAAFSPPPTILPTSDILFDAWALTSVREKLPGRPHVEPYLHGIRGWEPPETHVAWREEVGVIKEKLLDHYSPEDLLAEFPLKPHELLRDRSDRVFKHLVKLAERNEATKNASVWLVDDDGTVTPLTLGELADKDNKDRIQYRTVLLPTSVGGLKDGLLDGDSASTDNLDVADRWFLKEKEETRQQRIREWSDDPRSKLPDGMRLILEIDAHWGRDDEDEESEEIAEVEKGTSQEEKKRPQYWRWYVRPRSADDDMSQTTIRSVTLANHTKDVEERAEEILKALPFSDELKRAIRLAAKWHDQGKARPVFQAVLGNTNLVEPLAKSGGKALEVSNYRHEFGSLVDVLDPKKKYFAELDTLDAEMRDLVLHLIAAHHGYARPHFPAERAFDPEASAEQVERIASETPRRFARLQRRYGRWGLAYLESLLRAADYAASKEPKQRESTS